MSRRRPVLLYDGDCGFCRRWARRWQLSAGDAVEFGPYQELGSRFPKIPASAFAEALHFIEPDGRVHRGAEAVYVLLRYAGNPWWHAAYRRLPGFASASELGYRWVAAHRAAASRASAWLWGPSPEPSRHAGGTAVFLRALGLVYAAAFGSLAVQVLGLIGSDGLRPASRFLELAGRSLGEDRFRLLPTLFWLGASDAALTGVCWAGALGGLAVAAGFMPRLLLPALWAAWLSLCVVGGEFLNFQWDALLLEAGLLACLAAPAGLRPAPRDPPASVHWLLRLLLFKLMLQSGAVKLLSGDPSWRDLTALTYHFWTQPLPAWPAWLVHQLPLAVHKAACLALLVLELAVPFLVLAPRRPRLLAAVLLAALQLAIAATGNFAYFNALTIILCLPLIDDAALRRPAPPPTPERPWRLAFAAFVLLLTAAGFWAFFARGWRAVPAPLSALAAAAAPLRSVNNYGLFAVMTKSRLELSVEGSADGRVWKEYPFRWKPGDPRRRPPFIAPHQPRLDWQMWFAALSRFEDNVWLGNLLARLAQGSPPVLSLLAGNPFPEAPPRYLRVVGRDYRFTTREQRRATGAWWTVEDKGLYMPVVEARR